MQCEGESEPDCLSEKTQCYSFGGSGVPPTCRWLRSWRVALSSSLMPFVKLGSFSCRLFSRTFCLSCGLRLLNSFLGGGVYADGGRFGLIFGCPIMSARLTFGFGGRLPPEFCRSFCALRDSCCCCRFSRLCSCLCCCCLGGCCRDGWLCCLGGLLSCRFCALFARGSCANEDTATAALIPSATNHPANWSFRFILRYIC